MKYIETTSTNTVASVLFSLLLFSEKFFFRYHRNLFLKVNSLMTIVEKLDANGIITQSLKMLLRISGKMGLKITTLNLVNFAKY